LEIAAKLHQRDPKHYPDCNHKPEIGIALTQFETLHGLRSMDAITATANSYPELAEIIGNATSVSDAATKWLTAADQAIEQGCLKIYQQLAKKVTHTDEERWVLKLSKDYPRGDRGILAFFLMNLVKLKPGEAIYTPPGTLHAYLCGDLAECMANSDNVIRAGLTDKFKDIPALLKAANLDASLPQVVFAGGKEKSSYKINAKEFEVSVISSSCTVQVPSDHSVQLLVCLDGEIQIGEHSLTAGQALLIPVSFGQYEIRSRAGKGYLVEVPQK
jgi:mannose-6-phosphate isomerase